MSDEGRLLAQWQLFVLALVAVVLIGWVLVVHGDQELLSIETGSCEEISDAD
jgi:hypothetical protein